MYDLIVLGGGPGGYCAAERAGHAGLKTLLIEKRALGGVCLNEGCIPSKALLNSAKMYDHARHSVAYGVTADDVKIDQKAVIARKNKVVKTLVGGVAAQMKANHVEVVYAEGKILGKDGEGFKVEAGGKIYNSVYLIVATGSTAVVPPIPGVKEGLESGFVMTNREILDLEEIPAALTVIGGGVIGLEMASYFNSVGSKVTVVEMLNKIAGPTEAEISDILLKNYEKKGIEFKLGCKVTAVGTDSVTFERDGKSESVHADKVLLSIGRRPMTAGFGLENLHVEMDRAAIKTDNCCRTNISGLYAIGDVNGRSMLAHTAYREGEVAVNTILGKKDMVRYNSIPAVIYTSPEVATVGETEESAKAKGIKARAVSISMNFSGRYLAENEGGNGICKLIIDEDYRRIVGVHMIGSYASEIIMSAVIMVESEMRIDELKQLVFPHPTVSEIIREALFQI